MTIARDAEIREVARSLLNDLWRKRHQIWSVPPSIESLIPIRPEILIRSVLKISLEEPEAIAPETGGAEIAGLVDREGGKIVVAQKYKPEYRRFTMAHEIGHWVLHPTGLYHRDRPLSGGERANRTRPVQEQEADLFAAELTMPRKPLTDYFRQAFGEVVGPTASADLISLMSCGRVNEIDFRQDRRRRALVVAQATMIGPSGLFAALAKRFGVSGIAMAIQLEDLGLVT